MTRWKITAGPPLRALLILGSAESSRPPTLLSRSTQLFIVGWFQGQGGVRLGSQAPLSTIGGVPASIVTLWPPG